VKIQEADAKSLLLAQGLPVPPWTVARTPAEIEAAARSYFVEGAGRVVIKAQVLVGGRGKAGGVKLAASPAEAADVGSRILGMDIKGIKVRKVLVGAAADIVKEYYLGAIIDRASRRIVLMASAEGGVEIEEVARQNPGAIHRVSADPLLGLLAFQARALGLAIGLRDPLLNPFVAIAQGLFATMKANDADLVEINPLAIVSEKAADGSAAQRLVCLDAKITLDDSGLARHKGLEALRDLDEEDPTDAEARRLGINFIHLDGTIGCMVNGAGLAMATMDIIRLYGMAPANFLDVGGSATKEKVTAAFKIITSDPNVKGILVNIFGGIMKCDVIAEGVVAAVKEIGLKVPLVVRLEGTNVDLGKKIIAESKLNVTSGDDLDDAAQKIVKAVKEAA
jgi:succinyl-CoA synthetase beta subunit